MISICLFCSAEIEHYPSYNRKYCSVKHQAMHRSKLAIESGTAPFKMVRNYLIYENNNTCSSCGLQDWNDKPLTMHCDHIDGNRNNNDIKNLRLLCPNCHSQTDTWCQKNESSEGKKRRMDAFYKHVYKTVPR